MEGLSYPPRTVRINVRLRQQEFDRLIASAAAVEAKPSEYIRQVLREAWLARAATPEGQADAERN